jgi:hypothetical protein
MVLWNSNSLFNRNITSTKRRKEDMFLKLNSQYELAAWPEVAHPSFGNAQTNQSLGRDIMSNIYSLTTTDKMHTIIEGSEEFIKIPWYCINWKIINFYVNRGEKEKGISIPPIKFQTRWTWGQCLILLIERCHILESPKSIWMELTTAVCRVNTKCIVYG